MAGNNELEKFKTEINLAEFVRREFGYSEDESRSTNRAKVMESGNEKVVISRDQDGHFIYFNVHNDNDNGSIVDFIQNRKDQNLGEVRKRLRPFVGGSGHGADDKSSRHAVSDPESPDSTPSEGANSKKSISPPRPTARDTARFRAELEGMNEATDHDFLTGRGISQSTIQDDRFPIFENENEHGYTNVVFPHFDADGTPTGYVELNDDFKMFSEGSTKLMWRSRANNPDRVVIAESPVDALSYEELHGDSMEGETQFIATSGEPGEQGSDAIADYINGQGQPEVIHAYDDDEKGHSYVEKIGDKLDKDVEQYTHFPEDNEDWNDELQEQREQERQQEQSHGLSY